MFAIEIYIGEKKSIGTMIKSSTIPITHYQLVETIDLNNLTLDEKDIYLKLLDDTKGLAYEYNIHLGYNSKIIKSLINKNIIIKHEALEFKSANPKEKIKYIQYEDCFLIRDNKLINLSK
jgi:hypothetical protein